MRCSRCNAELADSATFCPGCGTPVQSGKVSAFSYLPTGTPPWPTTVPQQATPSAAPVTQTAELPPPSSRRPFSSVLLTIAVLILIPLIGAGITFAMLYSQGRVGNDTTSRTSTSAPRQQVAATPTAQPENQLPTPTSFKQISNTDVNISFKYPADWQADAAQKASDSSSVQEHIHSSQQVGIDFFIVHFSPSLSSSQFKSPSDVNQQNMVSLQNVQGINNLQTVAPQNSQPQIAGTAWTQEDGTFQDSRGNSFHVMSISVQHKNAYYTILTLIPQIYYSEATKKYIQPMLDSIQFLS